MKRAALACVAFAGAIGCTARSIDLYVPTDNVDLLFVVDDSSGTRSLQQKLVRNFPLPTPHAPRSPPPRPC